MSQTTYRAPSLPHSGTATWLHRGVTYDARGDITQLSFANDVNETHTYNAMQNLLSTQVAHNDGTDIVGLDYVRDVHDRVLERVDTALADDRASAATSWPPTT